MNTAKFIYSSFSLSIPLYHKPGIRKLILILFFIIVGSGQIVAQSRTKNYNVDNGIAIQGYDPVAYFTQNKAVKGSKQFSVIAEGVTYFLSSEVNKNLFLKDYKKYEPQYGGWCAYAMGATGEKVEIDPKTFKILQGKLYLFYHTWTNNTLPKWNADEVSLKVKADKNWNSINH